MGLHVGAGVQVENPEAVINYTSSEWAERGFCSKCGTHLYYRFTGVDDYVLFPGLFGDDFAFEFKEQIFIDSKPGFYDFANKTENLTGAELFAKYAPGS